MKEYSALLLFLVASSASAISLFGGKEAETKHSDFCDGYECPVYTVLERFDGYELRRYNTTSWSCAMMPYMESKFWDDHSYGGEIFKELFKYIWGANERGLRFDMTVPVVKMHTKDSVSMCFMIPLNMTFSPPEPLNDSGLFLVNVEAGAELYVRSFSGYQYSFTGTNYAKRELMRLLYYIMRDGNQLDGLTNFLSMSFNAPWQVFGRHNEVAIPKSFNTTRI